MDGNSYTYGPVIKAPKDQSDWDRWSIVRGGAGFVAERDYGSCSTAGVAER